MLKHGWKHKPKTRRVRSLTCSWLYLSNKWHNLTTAVVLWLSEVRLSWWESGIDLLSVWISSNDQFCSLVFTHRSTNSLWGLQRRLWSSNLLHNFSSVSFPSSLAVVRLLWRPPMQLHALLGKEWRLSGRYFSTRAHWQTLRFYYELL